MSRPEAHVPASVREGPRETVTLAGLAACALAGVALLFSGSPWVVPLGQALPVWLFLLRDLRAGRPGRAVLHMLAWAWFLSLGVLAASALSPGRCEPAILRGAAYREEMFLWIRTGVGAEGTPSLFIPQHLRHYAATLFLSLVTAGAAGLVLGAVLLNYMNFYVGSLVHAAARPALAAVFGWPLWSILRVAGFVVGSVAVAQIAVDCVRFRRGMPRPEIRRMLLASAVLVLADMVLKAVLAPWWRQILARALLP